MISMEEVVDTSISILKVIIEAIEFMEPSVPEEDMERILGTVDREELLFSMEIPIFSQLIWSISTEEKQALTSLKWAHVEMEHLAPTISPKVTT